MILTTGLFIFINIMTMIISICNKMIPRQPYLGWRAQERLKLSSSYLNPPTQVIIIVIIISWLSPQIIKMIAIPIIIIVAAAVGLLNTQPASPLLHLWVKPAWQECTKQNNTGGKSQFKHSSWSSFSWCPILATNSANLSTLSNTINCKSHLLNAFKSCCPSIFAYLLMLAHSLHYLAKSGQAPGSTSSSPSSPLSATWIWKFLSKMASWPLVGVT